MLKYQVEYEQALLALFLDADNQPNKLLKSLVLDALLPANSIWKISDISVTAADADGLGELAAFIQEATRLKLLSVYDLSGGQLQLQETSFFTQELTPALWLNYLQEFNQFHGVIPIETLKLVVGAVTDFSQLAKLVSEDFLSHKGYLNPSCDYFYNRAELITALKRECYPKICTAAEVLAYRWVTNMRGYLLKAEEEEVPAGAFVLYLRDCDKSTLDYLALFIQKPGDERIKPIIRLLPWIGVSTLQLLISMNLIRGTCLDAAFWYYSLDSERNAAILKQLQEAGARSDYLPDPLPSYVVDRQASLPTIHLEGDLQALNNFFETNNDSAIMRALFARINGMSSVALCVVLDQYLYEFWQAQSRVKTPSHLLIGIILEKLLSILHGNPDIEIPSRDEILQNRIAYCSLVVRLSAQAPGVVSQLEALGAPVWKIPLADASVRQQEKLARLQQMICGFPINVDRDSERNTALWEILGTVCNLDDDAAASVAEAARLRDALLPFLLTNNRWIVTEISAYFSDEKFLQRPVLDSLKILRYMLILEPLCEYVLSAEIFERHYLFFAELLLFAHSQPILDPNMRAVLCTVNDSFLSDARILTRFTNDVLHDVQMLVRIGDAQHPLSDMDNAGRRLSNRFAAQNRLLQNTTGAQLMLLLEVAEKLDKYAMPSSCSFTTLAEIFTKNPTILALFVTDPQNHDHLRKILYLLTQCPDSCFFVQLQACQNPCLLENTHLPLRFLLNLFATADRILSNASVSKPEQDAWRHTLYAQMAILANAEFVSKLETCILRPNMMVGLCNDPVSGETRDLFCMLHKTGYLKRLLQEGKFLHALIEDDQPAASYLALCRLFYALDPAMFAEFLARQISELIAICLTAERLRDLGHRSSKLVTLFDSCLLVATVPDACNSEPPNLLQSIVRSLTHMNSDVMNRRAAYALVFESFLHAMVCIPRRTRGIDNFLAGLQIRALLFDYSSDYLRQNPRNAEDIFNALLSTLEIQGLLLEFFVADSQAFTPAPHLLLQNAVSYREGWQMRALLQMLASLDPESANYCKTPAGWDLHRIDKAEFLFQVFTRVDVDGNNPINAAISQFTNFSKPTGVSFCNISEREMLDFIKAIYAMFRTIQMPEENLRIILASENNQGDNALALLWDGHQRYSVIFNSNSEQYTAVLRDIMAALQEHRAANLLAFLNNPRRAQQVDRYVSLFNTHYADLTLMPLVFALNPLLRAAEARDQYDYSTMTEFQHKLPNFTLKLLIDELIQYSSGSGMRHHTTKIIQLLPLLRRALDEQTTSVLFLKVVYFTLQGGLGQRPKRTGHLGKILERFCDPDMHRHESLCSKIAQGNAFSIVEVIAQKNYYLTEILWLGVLGHEAAQSGLKKYFFRSLEPNAAQIDCDLALSDLLPDLISRCNSFVSVVKTSVKSDTAWQLKLPLFSLTLLRQELDEFCAPRPKGLFAGLRSTTPASETDLALAHAVNRAIASCFASHHGALYVLGAEEFVNLYIATFRAQIERIFAVDRGRLSAALLKILATYAVVLQGSPGLLIKPYYYTAAIIPDKTAPGGIHFAPVVHRAADTQVDTDSDSDSDSDDKAMDRSSAAVAAHEPPLAAVIDTMRDIPVTAHDDQQQAASAGEIAAAVTPIAVVSAAPVFVETSVAAVDNISSVEKPKAEEPEQMPELKHVTQFFDNVAEAAKKQRLRDVHVPDLQGQKGMEGFLDSYISDISL